MVRVLHRTGQVSEAEGVSRPVRECGSDPAAHHNLGRAWNIRSAKPFIQPHDIWSHEQRLNQNFDKRNCRELDWIVRGFEIYKVLNHTA
jgi:hypothetical protein